MGRRKKRVVEDVEITGIADKGMAVGRTAEGEVLFVTGAVPGDVVDVLVLRKKKKVGHGIVKAFKSKSKDRVVPFCAHFEDCGGCKWQELDYEQQKHHKWLTVYNAMTRLGKLDGALVEPIVGAPSERYYRNKLEYSFSNKSYIPKNHLENDLPFEQKPALGFHVSGAWDKILNIEKCYLQDDRSNDIRNFVRSFCLERDYEFYDPRSHEGFMRNIIIRNTLQGDWMVIVIVSKQENELIMPLLQAIKDEFDFITSLNYVVNGKVNDVIYDLDVINFDGESFIIEQLGDVKYKIGPKSFFQTNSVQANNLFDTVVEMAGLSGEENVYDLYTGIGSIALYIAQNVKNVTGIEEVAAAIDDANENAILNGMHNTTFYAGDVKDILTDDFASKHGKPDLVITDPPRAGMHESVCKTLLKLRAPKIVYVSCNPATQARDLTILGEAYEVTRIKPVDMFPQTHHIENVALLVLKED